MEPQSDNWLSLFLPNPEQAAQAFSAYSQIPALAFLPVVIGIIAWIWTVYVVLAYIFVFIFLGLYIYAAIREKELTDLATEQLRVAEREYKKMYGGVTTTNDRWSELTGHIESQNPNDWKLAIIEADILLDDALKRLGYAGNSLGERLKSVSPATMATLDDAWEAHKLRNKIAHAGADFVLTHKLAREAITRYQRVFEELGVV